MINNNQVYSSMKNPEFNEIDNYLNTLNDINNDPLIWWKVHQKELLRTYSFLKLKFHLCILLVTIIFNVLDNTTHSINISKDLVRNVIGKNYIFLVLPFSKLNLKKEI